MNLTILFLFAFAAVCSAGNAGHPVMFAVPGAPVSATVQMTTCTKPEECQTACETQCPSANVANCVNGQCNCGI